MSKPENENNAADCSVESSGLFGNLFRDRDGDIGVGVESKPDHQGVPWIKLKYRNGRTSWMPSTFLTEVTNRADILMPNRPKEPVRNPLEGFPKWGEMPLDAALELADKGSATGGIMTNEALKSLAKGVRDLHAIASELRCRLEKELSVKPTANSHMANKAIERLEKFVL